MRPSKVIAFWTIWFLKECPNLAYGDKGSEIIISEIKRLTVKQKSQFTIVVAAPQATGKVNSATR